MVQDRDIVTMEY